MYSRDNTIKSDMSHITLIQTYVNLYNELELIY